MRNAIVFILIAILGTSIFGTYPTFCYLQSLARAEMNERREKAPQASALTKISSHDNLVWEEPGEEFHLAGKMYDVVYTSVTDSGKWFYCLDDEQEAKLYSALDKEVQQKLGNDHTTRGKTAKTILSLIFLDYLCPGYIELGTYRYCKADFFTGLSTSYESTAQPHASPPPELAS